MVETILSHDLFAPPSVQVPLEMVGSIADLHRYVTAYNALYGGGDGSAIRSVHVGDGKREWYPLTILSESTVLVIIRENRTMMDCVERSWDSLGRYGDYIVLDGCHTVGDVSPLVMTYVVVGYQGPILNIDGSIQLQTEEQIESLLTAYTTLWEDTAHITIFAPIANSQRYELRSVIRIGANSTLKPVGLTDWELSRCYCILTGESIRVKTICNTLGIVL